MNELSPLYDHLESLSAKRQYILRVLSLLTWFDASLFEHIVPFEKNRTTFEEVIYSSAVKQLSRIDRLERYTVVPILKKNLSDELRSNEPSTFQLINQRAARYFHRNIGEIQASQTSDVILELSYLSLSEPLKADELLARFGSIAIANGWLESAYRAASTVYERVPKADKGVATARLIMTLLDTLLADGEAERSQLSPRLVSAMRSINDRLSKDDPRRFLLIHAEDVLRAPMSIWAIESRNSAVIAARDEFQRSGYTLVRDRIFDPHAIELRRDDVEIEGAEKIRHEVEILFSLSAWTEWHNLSRERASVTGIGAGFFRPDDDALLDSLRLTDGSGNVVEHLRAVESRALAFAALERSEHQEGERSIEQPYLPLVALAGQRGAVPRDLLMQYEESLKKRPRVGFGSMDFEHQIDAVQARTQYVDIATPDGLVARDISLVLEPGDSQTRFGIPRDFRLERRVLTSKTTEGRDREIHRFVLHTEPKRDLLPYTTLTVRGRLSLPGQFFGWSSSIVLLSAVLSFLGFYISSYENDTSSLRYFLISVVLPFGALLDVVLRASNRERRSFGQRKTYQLLAAPIERIIGVTLSLFTCAVVAPTAGASSALSSGLFAVSGTISLVLGLALGIRWAGPRARDTRRENATSWQVRR